MKQLQSILRKEGAVKLAQVINCLESESHHRRAPQSYREFLYELSLNTPVCGMLQIAGNEEAIKVIQLVATGIDVRRAQYRCELKLLQDSAPVLASFLLKLPFSEPVPVDVCSLIGELCELLLAPFQPSTTLAFPPPSSNTKLAYFPNIPRIPGLPTYAADQRTTHRAPEDQDACRKYSSSHPTLTPGIFTIFCPHGVCCGFEVMRSHESPKHPFEIFSTRFETPPDIII